jgi:hypothetical protein
VGAGQNGGSHRIPGAPPGLVAEITRIAHEVFTSAYVTAMRQTLILPVALLAVGAISCLFLQGGRPKPAPQAAVPQEAEEAPTRA